MHTRASNSELVEHLEEPERTLNLHVPMANPDDDEPMWAADRVVAPTLSLKITIPATANEFAIKEDHSTLIKGNQFDAFVDEGNSNSDTDKIMARMDAMTMKMDAQYKEIKSRTECNHCRGIAEIMLVEVGKFTFLVDFVILEMEEDRKVPLILGRHFLYTTDAMSHPA
ncbi:reverse transcriptase domain-containing protein [Tanacetum coccineum]